MNLWQEFYKIIYNINTVNFFEYYDNVIKKLLD